MPVCPDGSLQLTAVAGGTPGGGHQAPLPRMPIWYQEGRLGLGQVPPADAVPARTRRSAAAHISFELVARLVLVALAALAVLVLLPAAIAAQATILI